MDKLKKYNQKLLAILGTILIAIAGLALIIGVGSFIISLIDFSDPNDSGVRIQETNTNTDDTTEFIRTQEVTFNSPFQLDTAQAKFIITVGQVNLEKNEKISIKSGGELSYSSSSYRYQTHYGLFNNFVYLNYSKNITKRIFDKQVAITYWAFLKIDTIEVLLFRGTSTDDNADHQLDYNDYQSLFAYYLNDDELIEYDFDGKTVLNFNPLNKTDLISINIGIDKNNDFNYEMEIEPQVITALNIRSRKVEKIISDKMKNEIQGIVDGM